ncbi:hypothetical protein IW140_000965 [Coemansia sp. RSA 1813]|nr:hypothetical protein LPJ74_000618 [Coemansia sp. RSA 1843]KAJ2091583.1 hypothetical protein IW138_001811 [Coemansia sp. RSA 986]KAJ2212370.1 hypothetical protein EV179_004695 [Coemansia sp. RSA 487]KAJ2572216.1 hypothetical protein IW140_000965 [Coemansia sp. RSA 1813]
MSQQQGSSLGTSFVKPYGSVGRRQKLHVNMIELKKYPEQNIYQYDVDLTPERGSFKRLPAPEFMRAVFDQAMRTHRTTKLKGIPLVYDARKIAYAPSSICGPKEELVLEVTYVESGRSEKFIIRIREVAVINTTILTEYIKGRSSATTANIQPALTALDLAVGSVVRSHMVGFNRSFFTREDSKTTSGGLELWRGFSFSIRPGIDRLYLNINTAVTAMYTPGSLLEALLNLLDMRDARQLSGGLSPQIVRTLGSYLRGVVLYLKHRGIQGKRKFSVKGMTTKPLDKESFEWEDPTRPGSPEMVTIAQYYQRRYNIKLQYPFLPGLVGRKNAVFPIELCDIGENQRYKGKLNDKQTADMVTFACQRPSDNMGRINRAIASLGIGSSPVVKSFGMEIPSKLAEVESRVLPAPTITYSPKSRESSLSPGNGAWNMRDKQVTSEGRPLEHWAVLVLANRNFAPENRVQNFITTLVDTCGRTGYRIVCPQPPIVYGNLSADIGREMEKACSSIRMSPGEAPQLLLVILPTTNTQVYQTVKNWAYTTLGIQTQCMQAKHIQRPNPQYCANLCLKINTKMGGTNQSLRSADLQKLLRRKPTLIMGCDVTHPAPGERNKPSIASVVGSTDMMGLRYAATLIQLPSRQELVKLLMEAVVRHLKLFFAKTKIKPLHIVFYRDGVSETQFAQTRDREITEILRACSSIETGYKPEVTFIAVLKRHNTRFYPMTNRDSDRTGNCVPGTIIDRSITLAPLFDFYLFSHAAIQGTSRPTHYVVLHNDVGFTADELQLLTYSLCYTYAICTRSVSLVPPVYYAHRVADRARCHMVEMGMEFEDASSASGDYYTVGTAVGSKAGTTDATGETKLIKTHSRLDTTMYFM